MGYRTARRRDGGRGAAAAAATAMAAARPGRAGRSRPTSKRSCAAARTACAACSPAGSAPAPAWLIAVIAVVVLWLASGFYRVLPDEVGVVLRFGAFNRTTPARPELPPAVADRERA